jgi:hypothetical protein
MTKPLASVFFLAVAFAAAARASSCGTVAAATTCNVTSNNITYTVGGFLFINSVAGGSGNVYLESDVNIDIGTGGAGELLLSFSKNIQGATPGLVFFANAGDSSSFIFTYNIAISPAAPGTVAFATPSNVSLITSSVLNNGVAQDQLIIGGAPTSCLMQRNTNGVTQTTCASLPPGVGSSLSVGNIVSVFGGTGNTGNATLGTFTNQFNASFTAETTTPEPNSAWLLGLGLTAFLLRPRKNTTSERYQRASGTP